MRCIASVMSASSLRMRSIMPAGAANLFRSFMTLSSHFFQGQGSHFFVLGEALRVAIDQSGLRSAHVFIFDYQRAQGTSRVCARFAAVDQNESDLS